MVRYNCAFGRGLDPSVLYEQYGILSLSAHYYDKASSNTTSVMMLSGDILRIRDGVLLIKEELDWSPGSSCG